MESIRTAQRKQSDGRVPNNHRCRRCCNNLSRQHRSLPTVTNSNCSKLYTQATLWLKHTNPTSDFTDILCVAELQQTKKTRRMLTKINDYCSLSDSDFCRQRCFLRGRCLARQGASQSAPPKKIAHMRQKVSFSGKHQDCSA